MVLLFASLFVSPALAGEGDPVDGTPTWVERDLHVWTNAARIAPHAFLKDAQEGGCSPSEWATTTPTWPLRFHVQLARVAREHSVDLSRADAGLSHDSTDGTSMQDRILAAYGPGKAFGENLAYGYPTARSTVLSGWMCSDGHRRNLLDPRFDEVGHGVAGAYTTQNLGDGGGDPHPINAATHFPMAPVDDVIITMDVWDVQGRAPDAVEAVVDGEAIPMYLLVGREGQGIYQGLAEARNGCRPWFVEARWGDEVVRWPETGSYGWGACDWDDPGARWLDLQLERGEGPLDPDGPPPEGNGGQGEGGEDPVEDGPPEVDTYPYTNLCATSPGSASVLLVLLAGLLGLRRRRR